MGTAETFGQRIRRLRHRRGLTQQQLSKLVKTGVSLISHWESGRHVPTLDSGAALAKALRVSMDYLAKGEGVRVSAGKNNPCVYIIASPAKGGCLVKIGRTEFDAETRVRQLNLASANPLGIQLKLRVISETSFSTNREAKSAEHAMRQIDVSKSGFRRIGREWFFQPKCSVDDSASRFCQLFWGTRGG